MLSVLERNLKDISNATLTLRKRRSNPCKLKEKRLKWRTENDAIADKENDVNQIPVTHTVNLHSIDMKRFTGKSKTSIKITKLELKQFNGNLKD